MKVQALRDAQRDNMSGCQACDIRPKDLGLLRLATGLDNRFSRHFLPLTPATFHILMVLVDGDRHGYAIMKEVEEKSDGAVRLGAGTLYGSLKRLLESGLVEESAETADPELGDDRRRYYCITAFGLSVLRAESRRMDTLVRAARQKKLIGLRST